MLCFALDVVVLKDVWRYNRWSYGGGILEYHGDKGDVLTSPEVVNWYSHLSIQILGYVHVIHNFEICSCALYF